MKKMELNMTHARIACAVVLALALPAGLQACSKPAKEVTRQEPRAVRVTRIELRPMNAPLATSGLLVPREEAAVTSELAGYRVARVLADQGAWVRKGQPLVLLDDTLLRSQIATQQVAAERADAQAARVADLDGKGVLSQEDIDSRRFDARSARASLNDLKVRQSRMVLRAPVGGLVLERTVRPGDLSGAAQTPMFRIATGGQIEVAAEVPETALGRIRPGQPVAVTLPDGAQVTGRVRLVSPEVDQQTKLGVARVSLPSARNLRPGGFARALFTDLDRPAMVAPDKAVNYDADGAYVMVVDGANKVRRLPVRTGARSQGYVELVQGPAAGARVLLTGATLVLEGDAVRPIETAAPVKARP